MKLNKKIFFIFASTPLFVSCFPDSSSQIVTSSESMSMPNTNLSGVSSSNNDGYVGNDNLVSVSNGSSSEPRLGYYVGFEVPEIVSMDENEIDIFVHVARARHIEYFLISDGVINREDFDTYNLSIQIGIETIKLDKRIILDNIFIDPYEFIDSDEYLATFKQEDTTICGGGSLEYLEFRNETKVTLDFTKFVDLLDDSDYCSLYVSLYITDKNSGDGEVVGDGHSSISYRKRKWTDEVVFGYFHDMVTA